MTATTSCTTLYGQNLTFFNDDFIGRKVIEDGVYEKETLAFLTQLLTTIGNATVLDIGANIGNHSLVFSLFAKQVYAFEPIPQIFAVLQTNIHNNNISNINAVNCACSNTCGDAVIYFNNHGNSGGSGFGRRKDSNIPVTVNKDSGDHLIQALHTGPIDLIKIDVEGHEYQVLDGLRKTIKTDQPFVLLEWADEDSRCQLISQRILETLFADYSIKVLGSNHDKQYWTGKPLGKWRRKLHRTLHKKKPALYSFHAENRYDNLLLIPNNRQTTFEQACNALFGH